MHHVALCESPDHGGVSIPPYVQGFMGVVFELPVHHAFRRHVDSHLIYDLAVRQIRENKNRRQIVVAPHNPNIVVNGDAEMLHALDFVAGECKVVQAGS